MPDYLDNQQQGSQEPSSAFDDFWRSAGVTASRAAVPRKASPAFDAPARIRELAPSYGVPEDLALKVLGQESRGHQYDRRGSVLTSPKGAKGAMQVLPATGRAMGYKVDDPEQNVHAGLDYLGRSYKRWNGDEALTLAGYHSGIDDAEKALRNPKGNPKTHGYVRSILGDDAYNQTMARYKGGQSAAPSNAFDEFWKGAGVEPSSAPQSPFDEFWQKSGIDQPAASSSAPKEVNADTLADYAKQHGYQDSVVNGKPVSAETNATTDLFNSGATIMQNVTADSQPIVSRATGAIMPLAPVDEHAVPQQKTYSPAPPQVQITVGDDETPDVKEIGRRVYKSLGFTDSEAEQYAKEMGAPDAPSAFYSGYGDPVKAAQAIKQMSHADPATLGRVNIPGLNEKAIAETKQWLNEKRQREYQAGMEGWHQSTLERLAKLSPAEREQSAYARAQQGSVPDDVRQALNVSPGVVPRLIAGTAESLMPWLPAARQMVGAKGTTADDVSTAINAAAQGTGGVIRSLAAVQQAVNAPLYHVPGVSSLLNWRDEQINGLVDEVSKKAQSELNLRKPSGLYGEILESSSRMAPEVAASILLPEGKAVHLAYWANLAFHNAKARGASDEDALKEAALAGAMIGAAAPLRPLAGVGGDAAKEALIKAGARAGLGAVTGYGIAKAQGANDNQAISMAVQFGAMNLAGAGGKGTDEQARPVPNEAAPRMRAFDVPDGMASATAYDAANPRAGAQTRADYESQRIAEESQQPNNAGMPRLVRGEAGRPGVTLEQTAPPVAESSRQVAPRESSIAPVVVEARGDDPMGTAQKIQEALRAGRSVEVARGGESPHDAETFDSLAEQFSDTPGVTFREGSAFESALAKVKGRVETGAESAPAESGLYKGKRVEFELNGRTVTGAVSSAPSGKVRAQLADGRMVTVEAADVRPSTSPLSTPDELQRAIAPRMGDDQRASLGSLSDALGRNVVESYTRSVYGKSAAELSQSEARQALAELRKQARAKGVAIGDESGPQSASQFVRSKGGIQYEEMYSGETRRLNSKESETTGLVSRSRSRGLPPDKMREAMVESGYLPEDATISDMYDLVERDAGGEKAYSQQDESYQRQIDDELAAMHEHYVADADAADHRDYGRIEDALNDSQFSRSLDRLHEPDATADDERAFYEAAQRHGLADDFIDETLAFAREHRNQPGGAENDLPRSTESQTAPARGEASQAGQQTGDVEHHSNFQPRQADGTFDGPPDYTLKPALTEPPKQTEHGYFHHFLHKAEGGKFFNDPDVKAALGLPESAKSSDVHAKLRDTLAPDIPGERPSLSRVSPDDLREWAVSRDLPDDVIAKLDSAHTAAKEKVSRNVELGGRENDHPQIVDWRNDLGEQANELSFGVNADRAMKSAAVLGYDLARGAKGFADWSQQMLSRLGERVKPLLRSLWDEVKGLTAGDEVDADSLAHLREKAARALENEKGAVSLDLLTLGIAPAVRKIDAGVRKLFAPDSISRQANVTGNAIRANRGAYERDVAAANDGLHTLRNSFLRMPEQEQVDFLDRLQNRQPQPTLELQAAHDALRRVYDAQVRLLAPRQQVRLATDYLSTFWKDAAAAKDFYAKWYQSHPPSDPPTVKDGLAAGLKPRSTNPVDVAMWHFNTARRYQFGQSFMGEMQSKGMAEYVGPGKSPKNRDWIKVDEAIQNKTGSQTGAYYMPEDAARVVNAWLSPDLKGRDDILGMGFRGLNRVNNWLNMFTLGWSAFHGTFTGLKSMFGQFNNSLQHLQAGKVGKAILEAGKIPISVPLDLRLGDKIIKEYNAPGTQSPEIARAVQAITQAGGRIGEDSIYRSDFRKQFMDAIRSGNYPQAAKNSFGAALEAGTAPILGWFVPRLKAAAFAKRAMLELDRLGPGATEDAQRKALAKQWDVVDDYFGQFVYDNSFANNAVKDIAKTTVGRFGWQYGTLRAGIGAAAEVAATPARVGKAIASRSTAGNAPIADRTGYAIGMVLMTGIAGGLTTYLMTGEKPKDAKDYFYPRTGGTRDDGSPERIAFPTYINEAYNWTTKPGQTAVHKISPAIHLFNDLLVRNADFQNVQIRNPNDSLAQQGKDVATYLGKQILPISVQNVQKAQAQGQGVGRQVAGVFGLKNAPSDIDVSPALALTRQYMGERMPNGVITKEQMAKRQAMRELEKGVRNKVPVGNKARQFLRNGVLSDDDVDRAIDHADMTPLEAGFKRLTYEQKLNVLDKALPDERKLLVPLLDDEGLDKLPDIKARQLKQRARRYEAHN